MVQCKKLASVFILSGLACAGSAFGASGTFTFVTGDVNVQRANGQRVQVTKGTPVNQGDAIVTGGHGMAQLTMVDQAKISLRPNTQFQIEQYADRPDSDQGALLNLVRGTLRTFTGLIAARTRDRFVMKTKVATVGIRGSGNVLFAGTAPDCDPEKVDAAGAGCDITVNHTIEGSHAVTFGDFSGTGLPPQQGGAQTLITGPGQTVLVTGKGEVKYIPTPQFIADSASNPTGAAKTKGDGGAGSGDSRNFGPNDSSGSSTQQGTSNTVPVGNNGLGFTFVDATGNLGSDTSNLRDIVISSTGSAFEGQATGDDVTVEGIALRSYRSYAGTQSSLVPTIAGGTQRDVQFISEASITLGRWENGSLGYYGAGSTSPTPGSIHWIYSASGYPTYLSDVLTGTATYTLAGATTPTNQNNTVGTLGSATLNVNFTNRTLNAILGVSMPGAGGNAGGSWSLNAQGVPFALNSFYASTSDRLVVTNGSGQSSASNANLTGSFEGSFVGQQLQGAILGYGIADQTSSSSSNYNVISGVAGFTGPAQPGSSPYRDGLISDPTESLASGVTQVRTYATVNRPAEVVVDAATGGVTEFAAPYAAYGGHATYARGTATVLQAGTDPETGMVWGRWSGGTATVSSNGQTTNLNLANSSLHYIFSGSQSGPVNLPLTGTASYDIIGSTSPTDRSGHVGTLNTATLNANFTNRTADAVVNVTVNGQTLNGLANSMPIYRDQYFSAYTPSPIPGASTTSQLILTCSPTCGPGSGGSIDGFFAGRSGQRAGMNYNLNGNAGAVAFGRRGG
ncbi:MAG: FecR domain-containing protein [Betaproteobacteria bacterium]|nr:FecR domain-containing protein [Betaproteobacteria bacterium]